MVYPREGVEIGTHLKDGMIENWDMFEEVMQYAYKRHLMADSNLHPILMSEPPWNIKQKRERLTELVFEKFEVPAFFLCKTAVLAAFANGRPTGLVVDSGATHTSAIPVVDGYCLTNSAMRSPIGGDALTQQCQEMLDTKGVAIVPPYLVGSKEAVDSGKPAQWTKRPNVPNVTASFHSYMVKQVVRDFQATMLQAGDTAFDADNAVKMPCNHYEFPNGYNDDFDSVRLRIPESLFNPAYLTSPHLYSTSAGIIPPATAAGGQPPPPPVTQLPPGVTQLILSAIGRCDIDVRPALSAGIIVTGGNSLVQGFTDRLQAELSARLPANTKHKLHAATMMSERRFGAWIGGSILASLGSFQQMWISKQEYEETGRSVVEKKCP